MTTISLRLEEADATLIKEFAWMNQMTVSDLIRQTVMEKIAEDFDLKVYEKAIKDFHQDPATYTHGEVGKMLEEME